MNTSRARSVAAAALLAASPWVVAQVSSIAAGAPRGSVQYVYDRAGNLTQVIDTSSDVDNCGQLGARCPGIFAGGARACVNGACGAMVDGSFYDVWSDATHCGASLVSCAEPEGGSATCVDGVCGVECWSGRVQYGLACLDLLSDPHNCGFVGNTCDPTVICVGGTCTTPGVPAVAAVNGVQVPGVALRSSLFTGITMEGINLDAVTWVELEDWGPDSVGTDVAAPAYVATLFGPEIAYLSTPSSLVIPAAAIDAFASNPWLGFKLREWYKVRLHYFDGIVYGDVLVDLAVSLDDQVPVDRPAPTITSAAVVELLDVRYTWGYDSSTGFIRLRDPEDCGSDPRLRPPVAVLAAGDPLHREYPVHAVTRDGIYIRAGVNPQRVVGSFSIAYGDALPDQTATLVYPSSGSTGEFVNLASLPGGESVPLNMPRPPRCWTEETIPQIGGFILRGTDQYGDCSLAAVDSEGASLFATFGRPVFLGDRTVVRPELWGWNATGPLISGIDRAEAKVVLSCARGAAAAPLSWLGAPVVDAVDPPFVMYEHVMRLTGKFFTDVQEVSFTWRDVVEHLASTTNPKPRVGEYHVVDENHIDLALSSPGGPVPRRLAGGCDAGVPFADVFPGVRGFKIVNLAGTGKVALPALDPSGPPEPSPKIECPPVASGGLPPPRPSPSPAPSVGGGLNPLPAGGDSTNRL